MGRSLRAASWAAETDMGRPMLIGWIMRGNITVLRTGRMIRASSGTGRGMTAVSGAVPAAVSSGFISSFWFSMSLHLTVLQLAEAQYQDTTDHIPVVKLVVSGRQCDNPLIASIGNLETMYGRGLEFRRKCPFP